MRASYVLPVTCSLHVHDRHLHQAAAMALADVIEHVVGTQILTGKRPDGYVGIHTFRRPNDTFLRVGPGEDDEMEAEMEIA